MRLDMGSGMRTVYTYGSSKGFSSESPPSHSDRYRSEEDQRVQRPKHCDDNKDEDNSLNISNVNNDNSSSHKFRQKKQDFLFSFLKLMSDFTVG